jgi:hypothetical protein
VKLAHSGGAAMDATIELAEKNPDWPNRRLAEEVVRAEQFRVWKTSPMR